MLLFIYIHCKEIDSDFIFNGVGPKRVTFKQMREGRLRDVITGFSKMIQSGNDVSLHDHTVITFYAFIPPVHYITLHYITTFQPDVGNREQTTI